MNDVIKFYTNPLSRGQIVRWMLEEIGLPYETHILEYGASMKAPEYLAINPMGKVPAIVHRGDVVTECAAICAYLAEVFPQAGLAPKDEERARYYRWFFFGAGPLEAAVSNKAAGFEIAPERERMFGYGNYDLTIQALTKALSEGDYFCGARFTAVDVYVGSQILWGMKFGSMPKNAIFEAYCKRLTARSAYQRQQEKDYPSA